MSDDLGYAEIEPERPGRYCRAANARRTPVRELSGWFLTAGWMQNAGMANMVGTYTTPSLQLNQQAMYNAGASPFSAALGNLFGEALGL
jgi:hypothetical protein